MATFDAIRGWFRISPEVLSQQSLMSLVAGWPGPAAAACERRVFACNDAFAELVMLKPAEVIGLPWDAVLGVAGIAEPRRRFTLARQPYEVVIARVGGDHEFVTVRSLASDEGERVAVASKARKEVLDMVFAFTHDLRNSLAALHLNLETLSVTPQDGQAPIIEDCVLCAAIMGELVNDVHVAGSSGAGHAFDPAAVVRAALTLARHRFASGWTVESDVRSSRRLDGNPAHLTQALLNLLVNAADACRDQPGSQRIRVVVEDDGPDLLVAVHDSGPGVPNELRSRIVSTHFTTKGSEGSGLGLAITRRMATEFGGTLEISDSPLGGAAFVLRLKPA